jgi:hypothetical protein
VCKKNSAEEGFIRESTKSYEVAFSKPVASRPSVDQPVADDKKWVVEKSAYRPPAFERNVGVRPTKKEFSGNYGVHRVISSVTPSYIEEGEVVRYQNSKIAGKPWVDAMVIDVYNDVLDANGQPYLLVRHDDQDGVSHEVNTTVSRVCEWEV